MTTIDLDANLADLSSDDFKSYFDDYLETSDIKEQSVVKGNVIALEGDWVTVDVGYKAEGRILSGSRAKGCLILSQRAPKTEARQALKKRPLQLLCSIIGLESEH